MAQGRRCRERGCVTSCRGGGRDGCGRGKLWLLFSSNFVDDDELFLLK